ncbi:hypothetical protein HA402_012894 [Bradysia odoriphaga]|nr:hypothetical protein HA402_012894 [Bradysia odoriphaga]
MISIFSIVWILSIVICIRADQCQQTSPCRCNYENGFGYDLQALEKVEFEAFMPNTSGIKYILSLCSDRTVRPDFQPVNSSTCDSGYAVCLYNAPEASLTLLANNKDAALKVDTDDTVYLAYTHGTAVTTVSLICTDVERNYFFVNGNSSGQANLALFSKHACKKELFTVSTLSTGAVLNITFLVIVFAYLVIGVLVDYFLMGARGIEVIPHLAFWKDFPFLVRDGIKFVQSGCKIQPSDLSENRDIYTSI